MQNISPRKYFETRLRQLPVFKCFVNADWEDEKMATIMVLRKHVNGNVSGSNFLVDLLCLGVKDTTWFFNTEEDELLGLTENAEVPMMEIPYELAHNIVYAGLEFAADYEIKPHVDFSIARYVLEDDYDSIPLIEIETGENGIPHLIERHPGQYADAHAKLKKHAGTGNFRVSIAFDTEDDADETEDEWNEEGESEIYSDNIELGSLTLINAALLSNEDLHDDLKFKTREETEQQKIFAERMVRMYEGYLKDPFSLPDIHIFSKTSISEVENIMQATEEDLPNAVLYPNGCKADTYEKGVVNFFGLIDGFPEPSIIRKAAGFRRLLEKNAGNPITLSHCLLYLLIDPDGESLLETLNPYLNTMAHLPLVALSQSFLVTAHPSLYPDQPLINSKSPLLKEVFPGYSSFSDDEYAIFYALRCLQAAQEKHIPLMSMWYRLLADTGEADIRMPMLAALYRDMVPVWLAFLKSLLPDEQKN
jgi:hypothetical protein